MIQKYTTESDVHSRQAWIVGGGIASLAASIFLIHEARFPTSHIHILESHPRPGGIVNSFGDAATGYVLHEGRPVSFDDKCIERLLSLVPSATDAKKTLWNDIRDLNPKDNTQTCPSTRILIEGEAGPKHSRTDKLGLNIRDRFKLFQVMLEDEHNFRGKKVSDVFNPSFFSTKFWMICSSTFFFSPHHSMFEFRRYLRKYLHDILKLKGTPRATRTRYTQYESIVQPITEYLQKEGIDFRLNDEVIDIILDQESQPNSVTQIKYRTPTGAELHVTVEPNDLVFIQLGALSSKTVTATNVTPPDMASISSQDGIWPLWRRLAAKTPRFGNPSTFSTNIKDSTVMTFTVTLNGSEFLGRLRQLVESSADSQIVIYLANSRWRVSLDIPCQPVVEGQPEDVHVIWGWALQSEEEGNYVKKPMSSCTGEEIMTELIEHLHFPLMPILSKSITIPCVKPLLTAPFLPCSDGDRPPIVPNSLSNVANLGQFVEMADETTFSMEYSVRSAYIAVTRLMGIDKAVPEIRRSHVAELLDLLS